MESPTESSLISKLESSDYNDIYNLFSTYLDPFTELINPQTNKKSKTHIDPSPLRTLAKKYLSFFSKVLAILPKRLCETPNPDTELQEQILELFKVYELCLQCLESLSSQLTGNPYSIHTHRVRMLRCFERRGRYKDAEIEALKVLRCLKLRSLKIESGATTVKEQILPMLEIESADSGLGLLVVEIVSILVKCACMSQSKVVGDYRRILTLVEELRPWFGVLDVSTCENFRRLLVTYLGRCALFLVEKMACFDDDLVRTFCSVALAEYANSSLKDQIQKFARRLCSSMFLERENRPSLVIDLLNHVLSLVARECKVEMESNMAEFLEFVSDCANRCRNTSMDFCIGLARILNKIAADFCQQVLAPFYLILRIYAMGLHFTNHNIQSGDIDSMNLTTTKEEFTFKFMLHTGDSRLQDLAALLGSFKSYSHIGARQNSVLFCAEYRDSLGRICSYEFDYEASIASQKNNKDHLLFYFNALKFLCEPLAELVNSAMKQILTEDGGASSSTNMSAVHDAFFLFCDVFLLFQSCTSEKERDQFNKKYEVVLSVAVAAFILSLRTKVNMQKSVNFIKHVISNGWLQYQGLKFLVASYNNVGIILYRNKQLIEAAKAFKLCCRASWASVLLLSQIFVKKLEGFHNDLSEADIIDLTTKACAKSAFLLDVLQHCSCHKVNRVIVDSLENWSVAVNMFKKLPYPMILVRQWVKIRCKLSKDGDVEDSAPTLYCLLSSSSKVARSTVGLLLEQELMVYEEMNSKFSWRMQMKIIDILLQDIYVTEDSFLQKSRILTKKGRALRFLGTEGLKDCIQCLSEAISIIKKTCGEICSHDYPVSHQLAVGYCLRALCTQEAAPNSKRLFQDIHDAVNLWLSIPILDHCSVDDQCSMVSEMMLLLYHVVDLLSLKGHMNFHDDIFKLLMRLFKWKNVSVEKSFAMLWEYRRLSHALCASPVSEAFMMNLSEHCGEVSKSIDFWARCLKGSQSLLVGFQQHFSSLFTFSSPGSNHEGNSYRSNVTIDEVKETALDLITSVPVASQSVLLAGHLYYDLGERLISNGRLFEALSYAKEAHQLRSKLLQGKFTYSNEEPEEITEKCSYGHCKLQMLSSVATEIWPCGTISRDFEGCTLSPWIVLQCYLESILQVGTIHELIGNGAEAEILLLQGREISCSQGLPLFTVAFSSVLGKLYRKKQFWDMAEKELQNAKQIAADSSMDISCLQCRLMLEVTIDQQLGDLSRSHFVSCTGNPSLGSLSIAENLYKSALDKLNMAEWKNCVSSPEELNAYGMKPEVKIEREKSRKTKKASKPARQESSYVADHNLRVTRSRSRSSQNTSVNIPSEAQIGLAKYSNGNPASTCPDTLNQKRSCLDMKNSTVNFGCEVTCICNNMKCWQCLSLDVMESGLVSNFIHMKWELVRRRLSSKLLTGIGKCLRARGEIHETHEVILQSISVLVSRNTFYHNYSSAFVTSLLDLIGKEIPGDVLAVERASVLYNICWFSLKSCHSKDTGITCCDLSQIQIPRAVSWLLLAFTLCREVPVLFQKVSRLLAAIYVLSASSLPFSLSSFSCKRLSESHWAAYFHQASIGIHLNNQLLSSMAGKHNAQHLMGDEDSCDSGSICIGSETVDILRLAPDSVQDLDKFVTKFFRGLPLTTVICISLLGEALGSLLSEILLYPSSVHAWMLLSRMNSRSQPVVILLPVAILDEASDDCTNSVSGVFLKEKDLGKQWRCPWGRTVVDDIVPAFKSILDENYLSSSVSPTEDTKEIRSSWWAWRRKIDQRLGKLLSNLENSWLGPWRYLLLGEWSDCRRLDSIQKKLIHDLKWKYKKDVNESLLKVILGGSRYAHENKECVPQLFLNKGCYIGRVRHLDGEISETLSDTHDEVESTTMLAFQRILEAANELEAEECLNREPVIMVLDSEVQMLPWENMPILRNQEVYRMPSVGSIAVTLDKGRRHQEQVARIVAAFPLIDPLDAFYLLNPSGDLRSTQVEFENWFRDQKLEGKAGTVPTTDELVTALKNHDLFIYFGHGSGSQYIPGHEIRKLKNCAATLLMGCSSGSLTLNGSYTPKGIPLSYLLAGSPIIIANLWEVTDKDIDRFGKAMLDAWLRERSASPSPSGCVQCNLLTEEFESMKLSESDRKGKKKEVRKKLAENCDNDFCEHRPKIGSFIGQAREACTLPYLIGAAPVCYGVPTGIKRKINNVAL